ncbi:5-oxoprolinase subunit PxpB [Salinibacillus xinjiangensis]|uniref:5-oxoprolinase subunit PxpB n=1 Tax=Salinibacillus xinjiangensis TaxID=1229268 RepID=A0A6G1X5T7_9BACI|nr:5-oxoprolinase subunit PxpB [Salinibacillus xinjiangensis]MRG86302.1 5-oxoprolinase subunit PxpB [Salinibacillus xinjiangensis]
MKFELHPLGDHAVIIELGTEINLDTHQKVKIVTALLDEHPEEWMVEYVPAFTTVTVFYDPIKVLNHLNDSSGRLPYDLVCQQLKVKLTNVTTGNDTESRIVEIPVLYGGDVGPDLHTVAEKNHLTPQEVIDIHSGGDYLVYMIGFAPGFPYIGGMSNEIATPRRKTPRLNIPAGTVGIAGQQTGVYPIETPGGWQLIGKTPIKLFRPNHDQPSLLQAGDQIRFKPITQQEFNDWEEEVE